jgi:hypothetical protein
MKDRARGTIVTAYHTMKECFALNVINFFDGTVLGASVPPNKITFYFVGLSCGVTNSDTR